VHAIGVAFIDELTRGGLQLPWHLARKRMNVMGASGRVEESWGTKFEAFVFDALSRSERSVTLEVARELEFSPVKNAEGSDSPATARADLCRMFAGWAAAAGLALPAPDANGVVPVEVDPLLAEDESSFVASGVSAPAISDSGHLYDAP
jgi:UDP-N-acetylglucosamine/UDP-N-acetylgalactosamine diphosphorylase